MSQKFDAVAIPVSIGYMSTVRDLRKAINTGYTHLNVGGILLIVANIRDNFKENNFVYKGSKNNIKITIFENNFITNKTKYEATIVYLIRHKKKLKIYTDKHTIGLFDLKIWIKLLKEKGMDNVLVVGGGIIPEEDAPKLKKVGVAGIFGPGTHCEDIVDFIKKNVKR